MPKFKAVIEYDGTAYHGWQLQKNASTVQGGIEAVLQRILSVPTRVHGAGRTDAGVHALGQTAHFSADWKHSAEALKNAMNALLPADIVIHSVEQVSDDFHSRFSAHLKTYAYRILNRSDRSAINRFYFWHFPQHLNVDAMSEASEYLIGIHDFAAFGSPTGGTPSTVRKMVDARWTVSEADRVLTFTICGTGFLRYMIRSIVGTLVLVGRNKLTPKGFQEILQSKQRSRSGPTAPAAGLFLMSVDYEAGSTMIR